MSLDISLLKDEVCYICKCREKPFYSMPKHYGSKLRWKEILNIPDDIFQHANKIKICKIHFEKEYLGTKRLKLGANPTLHLGKWLTITFISFITRVNYRFFGNPWHWLENQKLQYWKDVFSACVRVQWQWSKPDILSSAGKVVSLLEMACNFENHSFPKIDVCLQFAFRRKILEL